MNLRKDLSTYKKFIYLIPTATFLDPRLKKLHLDDGASLARTLNYNRRTIEENGKPEHCPLALTSASDDVDLDDNDDIWETHNKLLLDTMRTSQSPSQISEFSLYIASDRFKRRPFRILEKR